MKMVSLIIALLGVWEFGDIAALLVPNFGPLAPFVWSHILVGFVLIVVGIVGVLAARTNHVGTAKTSNGVAMIAGGWLIVGSMMFGPAIASAGFWNDFIVGCIVVALAIWMAMRLSRRMGLG